MEAGGDRFLRQRQVLLLFIFLGGSLSVSESRRYSVAEEKEKGFLIANLAKDLGLRVEELAARGTQVVSKGNKQHFQLNHQTGDLLLNEKLDREELCGPAEPCILHFQILLQNPLQFVANELQIIDVNDHSPVFFENEMQLKLLESTPPGTVIPLGNAEDLDVGRNSLQNYTVAPNAHFHVLTRSRRDGKKYAELVLDKALDREEQPELSLTLVALDGGSPPRSATAQIHILVLDINDNAPEFAQSLYEVQILENSPPNSVIVTVSASDLDTGNFGTISYAFFHASEEIRKTFQLNPVTGDMHLVKYLNFEAISTYEVDIEAKDGGGLSGKSTVLVQVVDVNDNPPELTLSSVHSPIPENSAETVVAVFSVSDLDSGDNGRVTVQFLHPSIRRSAGQRKPSRVQHHHHRHRHGDSQAEDGAHHNRAGLRRQRQRPRFSQSSYTLFVPENNSPALHIGSVSATDRDSGSNAQVTYSRCRPRPAPAARLAGLHQRGQRAAVRPEVAGLRGLRAFEFRVAPQTEAPRAAQRGAGARGGAGRQRQPAFVLYPPQNGSAPCTELLPRAAEPVVAVDGDSARTPGCRSAAQGPGRARPARHRLVVLVRDSGEPALSASVTLHVLLVDGFSQPYLPPPEGPRPRPGRLAHRLPGGGLGRGVVALPVLGAAVRTGGLGGRCSVPEGPFRAPGGRQRRGTLSQSYQYRVLSSSPETHYPQFPCSGSREVSEANPSVRNSFEFS
uniref:Protocadherin beta 3 n=1 Tax=Microcebus murinus TaxID=30608 RepID=A0A8C5V6C5_MICMU